MVPEVLNLHWSTMEDRYLQRLVVFDRLAKDIACTINHKLSEIYRPLT